MSNKPLISAQDLQFALEAGGVIVVDCRYDFADAAKGRRDWLEGHLPGARYAHLDDDLAAPVSSDSGRHPLPDPTEFAGWLSSIGWTPDHLLVAYDQGNAMFAARLWWMMRYYGFASKVLDGGLAAWNDLGYVIESGDVTVTPSEPVRLEGRESMTVDVSAVMANLENSSFTMIDARAPERYSGEVEPLDTAAGHIPGALNRVFAANLDGQGKFRPAEELAQQFNSLLGDVPAQDVVHSCGSGVTACHNLLAMEVAGLGGSRVYTGSWSEWIRDPARPTSRGSQP